MKKRMLTCLLLFAAVAAQAGKPKTIDEKVEELLSKMTLEEKVGQMAQVNIDPVVVEEGTTRPSIRKMKDAFQKYHIGSILNVPTIAQTPEVYSEMVAEIQHFVTTQTRLGIPVIYGLDQTHGSTYSLGGTIFPQELALAATWNPGLARTMGEVTAYETRACSVPWVFAPIFDLGADPRFPRLYETFGEDPYLCGVFGAELVAGMEGDAVSSPFRVAACMKHFLGYGVPANGKDRTPAHIPAAALREYHVPPFQAAVNRGVRSAMINSGIVNGIPVHASRELLTDLLRTEMGFEGVVVTDYEDIEKLHSRDRLAATSKEAVEIAVNAGIDMSMIPIKFWEFCPWLVELVNEGKVPMARIDQAVRRILRLKFELGLFETPATDWRDYPKFGSDEFAAHSRTAAAEAITLLKNEDGILPLKKGVKLLVTGPCADSHRAINGGWTVSWLGDKAEEHPGRSRTIADAVAGEFGAENVRFIPGVSFPKRGNYFEEYKDRFEEAVEAAKSVDYVILCIGESSYSEKPGDLDDLSMSPLQTELAQQLAQTGAKIVCVLAEGRPRVISRFEQSLAAILMSYQSGPFAGEVVAETLSGEINPSGKLPVTYPKYPSSHTSYIHKYADQQMNSDQIYTYEGDYCPQFAFGHGLSYTTFEYANARISRSELSAGSDEAVTISVDVTNSGSREGSEVVQLYSSDLYASYIPDVTRLRRFEKIALAPGETRTVTFRLQPRDLGFWMPDGRFVVEPGDFRLLIGASSADFRGDISFRLTE